MHAPKPVGHRPRPVLTGVERYFDADEVIVSKTDPKGFITYANEVFQRIAGFTEAELLGQPHSIVRHPDMPRCVFKLLWDTIRKGEEIFAYVVNRAKNGDHYWVFAHVTPTHDERGGIVGYHSNRRVPSREAVEFVTGLYAKLLTEESKHAHPQRAVEASTAMLVAALQAQGITYEELAFRLATQSGGADRGRSGVRTDRAAPGGDRASRPRSAAGVR